MLRGRSSSLSGARYGSQVPSGKTSERTLRDSPVSFGSQIKCLKVCRLCVRPVAALWHTEKQLDLKLRDVQVHQAVEASESRRRSPRSSSASPAARPARGPRPEQPRPLLQNFSTPRAHGRGVLGIGTVKYGRNYPCDLAHLAFACGLPGCARDAGISRSCIDRCGRRRRRRRAARATCTPACR